VAGREPLGAVSPGAEYETLREQITAELTKLNDPRTGEPICEHVWKREDVHPGDAWEQGSDIFMRLKEEYSAAAGQARDYLVSPDTRQSASHSRDGIIAAAGTRIRQIGEMEPVSVLDVTPTVLALSGIESPGHIEGRALGCVDSVPLAEKPEAGGARSKADETGLTEEERQTVTDRLRDLGYL
jgi:predicted AlkP superfamily phosphohydrolase/phosphomutase